MSKRYLWVVELMENDAWVPTWRTAHTKGGCTELKKDALEAWPQKKYRVVKYTPAE